MPIKSGINAKDMLNHCIRTHIIEMVINIHANEEATLTQNECKDVNKLLELHYLCD